MSFYLGFDAGGTKTDCALADETQILARTQNGSIKPLRVSAAQAEDNMRALLEEISRQSGVDLKQVAVSCVGTAGVRFPQTKEWMEQIISRYASGEILVCGDETTALDAAFPSPFCCSFDFAAAAGTPIACPAVFAAACAAAPAPSTVE